MKTLSKVAALVLLATLAGVPGMPANPAMGHAGDAAWQTTAETDWPAVTLAPTGWGVRRQTFLASAGDGSGRLFLVQQDGQIWIVKNDQILAQPFLDISPRVACCGEQGLLSVAFPPDYASSGVFYVYYTRNDGTSVVARHFVSAEDPDRADPDRSQTVLRVTNERVYHNGGHLAFGPDAYLYLSLGDDGFDTRAQQLNRFHGKVLRIDVQVQRDQAEPLRPGTSHQVFLPAVTARVGFTYRIPPSNPFIQTPGALGEIWAYGLRNPWRFAFDGTTGDLYLADVGEYVTEEVDFRPASSPGGENYGWPVMEGSRCRTDPSCDPAPYILPVAEYGHTDGQCAVIGGVVYRGTDIPGLDGAYLFGDFCTGRLWGLRRVVDSWETALLADAPYGISSIGVDESGEVYVVEFGSQRVRRLEPAINLRSPS